MSHPFPPFPILRATVFPRLRRIENAISFFFLFFPSSFVLSRLSYRRYRAFRNVQLASSSRTRASSSPVETLEQRFMRKQPPRSTKTAFGKRKKKKTLQRRPAGLFAKGVTDHTASAQLSTDPPKLNVTKEAEKRNARVVGYSSLLLGARRSRCTREPVVPRANFTECTVRWRN